MKDLVIKVGEYEKDGEKKGRYVKLGTILNGDNGEYALIEPTVDLAGCMMQQRIMNGGKGNSVMCSIFDKSADKARGDEPGMSGAGSKNSFDDDIGF